MRWIIHLLSNLLALAVNGSLFAALALLAIYAWVAQGLPERLDLSGPQLQQPLRIYSTDGLLMAEFGAERREPLSFADTPPLLVKAFLATEDSRFFQHPGIDIQGLARAALNLLETGKRSQGGSTITMQVARNFFLSREKSFERKLAELALALRIERELSKGAIFELYQNKIFFGHRAYGISAAARVYYDQEVRQLSLAQMAMLAGVPQAPSTNNPVSRPGRALARRNYVLGRMLALGYITAAEHDQALAEVDQAQLTGPRMELEASHAAEMARREIANRYGPAAYTSGYRVTTTIDGHLQRAANEALRNALLAYDRRHGYRGAEGRIKGLELLSVDALEGLLADHPPVAGLEAGIVIRVEPERASVYLAGERYPEITLAGAKWARPLISTKRRGRAPRKLSDVIAPGDRVRLRRTEDGSRELAQLPAVEGALAALSPADGAVKAMVGGFDFRRSQFNRAVDARRQPGSSFKPLVYAAALERGWTPATLVHDEPLEIPDGKGRVWRPKNFGGKYLGPIRLREALTHSRNLASIDLLRSVGVDYTRDFIGRFGFTSKQLPRGLSLVLGSGGASPLQMAGAYARFANGGYRTDPYLIERVEDPAGKLLFQAESAVVCIDCAYQQRSDELPAATTLPIAVQEPERVLAPGVAYQMHSLLADVIRTGTGRRALSLGRNDLAGKTGTSNDVRDSWFCGFQKQLVTVAWMGFDDFSPLGSKETGGHAALGMWIDFMGVALEGEPEDLPEEPPGLLHVLVNRYSGTLTSARDPDAIMETVREAYEVMLLGPEMASYPEPEPEPISVGAWEVDTGFYPVPEGYPPTGLYPVPESPAPRGGPSDGMLQQLF